MKYYLILLNDYVSVPSVIYSVETESVTGTHRVQFPILGKFFKSFIVVKIYSNNVQNGNFYEAHIHIKGVYYILYTSQPISLLQRAASSFL